MAMSFDVDERAIAEAYASKWWLFLISGILWLFLGFIVLSLRPASISVCVILIAVAFWLGAMTQFALGAVTTGGWRVLTIVGGIVALGAGIAAIVWPGPTLVVISIFVAWYLLIRGIFDVAIVAVAHAHPRAGGWGSSPASSASGWVRGRSATPTARCCCSSRSSGSGAIFKGAADLVAGFSYRSMKKELAAT